MVRTHPDPPFIGGVAQLGERLLCKQEVIGSIPFTSTNLRAVARRLSRRSAQARRRTARSVESLSEFSTQKPDDVWLLCSELLALIIDSVKEGRVCGSSPSNR